MTVLSSSPFLVQQERRERMPQVVEADQFQARCRSGRTKSSVHIPRFQGSSKMACKHQSVVFPGHSTISLSSIWRARWASRAESVTSDSGIGRVDRWVFGGNSCSSP